MNPESLFAISLGITPPWLWEHIRFFNKKVIGKLLNTTGFKITDFSSCDRRLSFNLLAKICELCG